MTRTSSRGPIGAVVVVILVLIAVWEVWEMRVGPVTARVGELLEPAVMSTFIKEFGNAELRHHYTGIDGLDFALRFLVVAFMPGVLGIDRGIKLQQAHFLISFFSIISIMSIEAGRRGHDRSLIFFTSIWGLLYQTIGGAIVIPLYHLAYMWTTSRTDHRNTQSHTLPTAYAKALLPALVLGYLLPTILIYLPYGNVFVTQGLVALWQPSPIIVNLLLTGLASMFSVTGSKTETASSNTTDYVKHLRRIYAVNFIVGALVHWGTIAACLSTSDPNLSFFHALWPNKDLFLGRTTISSMSEGLHYIFQMDYWGVFASSLIWAYLALFDMYRESATPSWASVRPLFPIIAGSIIFGPSATITSAWYHREAALASSHKSKRL